MSRCLHCGRVLDEHDEVCPACAKPNRDANPPGNAGTSSRHRVTEDVFGDDFLAGEDALVPIARFRNVAEAGYFAHELQHTEQIPVSLTADEHFDAISGDWSTRFVLSVPEAFNELAARTLSRMVAGTEPDELIPIETSEPVDPGQPIPERSADGGGDFDRPDDMLVESTVHWVPIVLTLAAGSVAFWGWKQAANRPRPEVRIAPVGGQQDAFWEQLGDQKRPWIQRLDNGRGTRELWIDNKHGMAIIREDADGDGHFEKEQPFRRAVLNQ